MAVAIIHKQAIGRVTLIILLVVSLLLTYALTSLAFNSGSLWEYGFAFLGLILVIRIVGRLLATLMRKGKRQAIKA